MPQTDGHTHRQTQHLTSIDIDILLHFTEVRNSGAPVRNGNTYWHTGKDNDRIRSDRAIYTFTNTYILTR